MWVWNRDRKKNRQTAQSKHPRNRPTIIRNSMHFKGSATFKQSINGAEITGLPDGTYKSEFLLIPHAEFNFICKMT